MKIVLSIVLILIVKISFSQEKFNYGAIDWRVQNIEGPTPDSLAKMLTAPYSTQTQKVRAIFSWIAQHIAYNTFIFNSGRKASYTKYISTPDDTSLLWKPADEMTAIKVLRKRTAVCDGYAKLFKTLCDYAGVKSQVITGYAKCYMEQEQKFRTNHTWNAVLIDSTWHLLDVTWASGYISYTNQFVQRLDESYFLSRPEDFIHDHYPEDLKWTLLKDPPTLREYNRTPFLHKSFIKYSITSYQPGGGIIKAAKGDTVQIELCIKDAEKDKSISSDPFFDSSLLCYSPTYAFLSPSVVRGNKIIYTYVINSDIVVWLHILYNEDVVLRYRLEIKKDPDKNLVQVH